jgi:glutamyl-tRNA reductase
VPRDVDPSTREVAGVTVYDVDGVQEVADRNAAGREAETERARSIVGSEVGRFENWLASLEVVPTVTALRERADEIVERVLAENEARWEELSEGDRERIHAMARSIAGRLLHEPTLRLKRSAGSEDAYLYISALRELFALDSATEPEGEGAEVRTLRSRSEGRESA